MVFLREIGSVEGDEREIIEACFEFQGVRER